MGPPPGPVSGIMGRCCGELRALLRFFPFDFIPRYFEISVCVFVVILLVSGCRAIARQPS